jgi:hypothetical protein
MTLCSWYDIVHGMTMRSYLLTSRATVLVQAVVSSSDACLYACVCVFVCVCIYIYIYILRAAVLVQVVVSSSEGKVKQQYAAVVGRERQGNAIYYKQVCMYVYACMYVCMYVCV